MTDWHHVTSSDGRRRVDGRFDPNAHFLLPDGLSLHSESKREGPLKGADGRTPGGWLAVAWVEDARGVHRCVRTVLVADRWRTPRNRRLAHLKAEQLVLAEVSRREYARLHGTTA